MPPEDNDYNSVGSNQDPRDQATAHSNMRARFNNNQKGMDYHTCTASPCSRKVSRKEPLRTESRIVPQQILNRNLTPSKQ